MEKNVISEKVSQWLTEVLEKRLNLKLVYKSPKVIHLKCVQAGLPVKRVQMVLNVLADEVGDCNVLIEYPLGTQRLKFFGVGNFWVNTLLSRKFGGLVSEDRYWVLNNEAHLYSLYGYIGTELPTAQDIIQFMEEIPD